MVQWLQSHASTTGGVGSISKMPQAAVHGQKVKYFFKSIN